MIKRNRLPFILTLVFLLTTSLIASSSSARSSTTEDQIKQAYIEAVSDVEQHYAGTYDYNDLNKSGIDGMLHSLDPHSNYMDPKEYADFREKQQSQYSGIGATITNRAGQTYILTPFPNAPAERAGLHYGDHVININGESSYGWSMAQVSEKMLGPRGTQVKVTVARPGEKEPLTFNITRDVVPLPSITVIKMVSPNVGYIHLEKAFNFTTADELRNALDTLKAKGATSYILDLRENPGGLLNEALEVLDDFLGRGNKLLSVHGRRSEDLPPQDIYAHNSRPDQSPLIVLINRDSASASEIVAGALQDHDRAWIVGENSFGKGLVQTPFQLPGDAGLYLTTGKYLTPSGRLIQRDYSKIPFWTYILMERNGAAPPTEQGPSFTTDNGRQVYGGGGITPDTEVKSQLLTDAQIRLLTPQFMFTRQLINGQIAGLESYKYSGPKHESIVNKDDLPVSDAVLTAFEAFVKAHPEYGVSVKMAQNNREYVRQRIRFDLANAVYGVDAAEQILMENDPVIEAALKQMPQAAKLASAIAQRSVGMK
ncbi:MAG TPA: S41 family peptidase [Blastocatellia bacterium]|nr:S41 family peptidase [Blastocatellia bacterium]